MSAFREYLHEMAEESRHSETVGYLVSVMGSVFLVGGILETAITVSKPGWFLVFPYAVDWTHPYGILGLGLTIIGFVLLLTGIVIAVYYLSQRSWYMGQLRKAHEVEELTLRARPIDVSAKMRKSGEKK